ncbi:MAG: hypothetical protein WCD28_03320 [Nitrososphaeraceae archaeon]
MKNPPHSSRHGTPSQYLAEIMTFYALKDVPLNKKNHRYLGEGKGPTENRGYNTVEIWLTIQINHAAKLITVNFSDFRYSM